MSFSENSPAKVRTQGKKVRKNGEGSTYWDKQINRYTSAFKDIHGKTQRASFKSEDDAIAWRIQNIAERDKGNSTQSKNPKENVDEFLERWLNSRLRKNRPNTIRTYDIAIRTRINPHARGLRRFKASLAHSNS